MYIGGKRKIGKVWGGGGGEGCYVHLNTTVSLPEPRLCVTVSVL